MQSPNAYDAFCWLSRQHDHSTGAEEVIEFGLVDSMTTKWISRLTITWPSATIQPVLNGDLGCWCVSVRYRKLATRLKALVYEGAPAWRFALEFCSCDFTDITRYSNREQESEFMKGLRELEERTSRIHRMLHSKDDLA